MEIDVSSHNIVLGYLSVATDTITSLVHKTGMECIGSSSGLAVVHMRGGEQMGLVSATEDIFSVMYSNDIIHRYDTSRKLIERREFGDVPQGYVVLTRGEIDQLRGISPGSRFLKPQTMTINPLPGGENWLEKLIEDFSYAQAEQEEEKYQKDLKKRLAKTAYERYFRQDSKEAIWYNWI